MILFLNFIYDYLMIIAYIIAKSYILIFHNVNQKFCSLFNNYKNDSITYQASKYKIILSKKILQCFYYKKLKGFTLIIQYTITY